FALSRLPDLRASAAIVRERIGGVGVLIRAACAWHLAGKARGDGLVVVFIAVHSAAGADHHLGAIGAQQAALLLGDLIRHDADQPIALDGGGQRETRAGVAAGRLDNRAARLELAATLHRFD